MTQDELTLVLEALKWCHGGEPCGTAEAIAVIEKALANVATNDTPKERVDEIQKQRHEQEPVCDKDPQGCWSVRCQLGKKCKNTPPQRTWVGLTNDELTDLFYNTNLGQQSAVAQAIALLKERNT